MYSPRALVLASLSLLATLTVSGVSFISWSGLQVQFLKSVGDSYNICDSMALMYLAGR